MIIVLTLHVSARAGRLVRESPVERLHPSFPKGAVSSWFARGA